MQNPAPQFDYILTKYRFLLGLPDCCILNTGAFFNHVNLCSCANIQQQESRAVADVLGLKFANIIHSPKLTIVGLASVPVKILKN